MHARQMPRCRQPMRRSLSTARTEKSRSTPLAFPGAGGRGSGPHPLSERSRRSGAALHGTLLRGDAPVLGTSVRRRGAGGPASGPSRRLRLGDLGAVRQPQPRRRVQAPRQLIAAAAAESHSTSASNRHARAPPLARHLLRASSPRTARASAAAPSPDRGAAAAGTRPTWVLMNRRLARGARSMWVSTPTNLVV